jgi:predicted DNA-binding transcriptional regulator AlpA
MTDLPASLDIQGVCSFWGGNNPLSPATIYRQIARGKHPKPFKVGGVLSRWNTDELIAERDRRMAERGAAERVSAVDRNSTNPESEQYGASYRAGSEARQKTSETDFRGLTRRA